MEEVLNQRSFIPMKIHEWILLGAISAVATNVLSQDTDDPAALYLGADYVFTGRLLKLNTTPAGIIGYFEPSKIIKGDLSTNRKLRAEIIPARGCHALVKDHSYLIYGHGVDRELVVDPCSGSKLVSEAERDLRYLHTVNSKISERCSRARLAELARQSPIVITAEVLGTEDSTGKSESFFRPWCGLTFTTEDAYYHAMERIKGEMLDEQILVEHPICWDTVTIAGYSPTLSPDLFKEGNILLLFLKPGSSQEGRQPPSPYESVYEAVDENCGAVLADDDAARITIQAIREHPDRYLRSWLDESVDWLITDDSRTDFTKSSSPADGTSASSR